jgi:hypothetical protein
MQSIGEPIGRSRDRKRYVLLITLQACGNSIVIATYVLFRRFRVIRG